MKMSINKEISLSAITPAFAMMECGSLVCRDADEEAIIRAYRDLPRGEVQKTAVRYMCAVAGKFGASARPRLTLVAGSKGLRNE